jgi:polyhydroxyalkanoate synthase subunit PhaC
MANSEGSGAGMGFPMSGQTAPFAPFEMWMEWFKNNMGNASATPGAGVPWLMSPGISTGEEELPEGAVKNDPLMSAMQKAWEANPVSSVIPIDWIEITRALQTLWMREMSDPVRATQVAADYNRRFVQASMEVWQDAAYRFWGLPRPQEEGEQSEQMEGDKRFSAPEWGQNPYYETLKQLYLLASDYLLQEAEETANGQADTEEQRRLKFHLRQFVEAMAPVNFFLTNPAAIKRAIETGGTSLVDGARNLMSDLEDGSLSMVDSEAFEVGENLATTPGKVVYRNRLMELIQYEPRTEKVHEVPIVFIPPWINKYYIVDLRPENSFVKYMLEQGFQFFMISWKNPDASMADVKFEDYMHEGPLEAVDVALEITGAEKVNPIGYCIGGTLLAMMMAYLAAGDDEERQKLGPPTFMVSLQDFSEVGELSAFIDEPQVEFMEMQMLERGYLGGRNLANVFNLLQPRQLVWSNVINNYLLGQKPPAFDMLYWNSDSTRQPRDAQNWYLRNTYLENNLVKPGKIEFDGRPLDLGKVTGDIYAVGAEKDHIVPWRSAWSIGRLTGGNVRFTLAAGGHIAGMMAPPDKAKGYWASEETGKYETPEEWLENAEQHEGTWWEDFISWLEPHSGEQVDPPQVGSDQYPPIEDAPGTYVKES